MMLVGIRVENGVCGRWGRHQLHCLQSDSESRQVMRAIRVRRTDSDQVGHGDNFDFVPQSHTITIASVLHYGLLTELKTRYMKCRRLFLRRKFKVMESVLSQPIPLWQPLAHIPDVQMLLIAVKEGGWIILMFYRLASIWTMMIYIDISKRWRRGRLTSLSNYRK